MEQRDQHETGGFADSLREAQRKPDHETSKPAASRRHREEAVDGTQEAGTPQRTATNALSAGDVTVTDDAGEQAIAETSEQTSTSEVTETAETDSPIDAQGGNSGNAGTTAADADSTAAQVNASANAASKTATPASASAMVAIVVAAGTSMAADQANASPVDGEISAGAEETTPAVERAPSDAVKKSKATHTSASAAATSVSSRAMQSSIDDTRSTATAANPNAATTASQSESSTDPGQTPQAKSGDSGAKVETPEPRASAANAKAVAARLAHAASSSSANDVQASPASARAVQVDQAIRAENATGQVAMMQLDPGAKSDGASNTASTASASIATTNTSGHATARSDQTMATLLNQGDAEVEAPNFATQTIRGLTAMLNQRGGAMTLRLDPPELGALRVQMTIVGGNVSAEFIAGTQQTQALLDRHMSTLRQSLESQGLNVERLTVHAAPPSSASQQSSARNDDGGANAQQQQWGNQHNAAGGESRGRREDAQPQQQSSPQRAIDANAWTFASLMDEDTSASAFAGAHT